MAYCGGNQEETAELLSIGVSDSADEPRGGCSGIIQILYQFNTLRGSLGRKGERQFLVFFNKS